MFNMSIEHKTFEMDFCNKEQNPFQQEDSGSFSAYVARFSNVDRDSEVIEPGAFKNLPSFISDGWVAWNHDKHRLPVAMIESASQDSKGLLVNARWHSHAEAQACRSVMLDRMKAGRNVACSIGYRVLNSTPDKIDGKSIRRLRALDIFECSVVSLPANPAASVLSAKSLDPDAPKLIAVAEIVPWLEMETKAGREISDANETHLRGVADSAIKAGNDLHAFLDQRGPKSRSDKPDDSLVAGGGRVVGKAAHLKQLRLRSAWGRAKAVSLLRE
jgi:HK97 family phage prohead protease